MRPPPSDRASDALAQAIDGDRQWDRLMRMGSIGAVEETGVDRPCLSEPDRAARRLLIEWAGAAGATVSVDEAANLWLRREGTVPGASTVLTGSHMDSQPRGGRFDGIWGVIAGLEVMSALQALDLRTPRPIELVAWTNEEGGRFAPGCMGSMAWSGHTPLDAFSAVRDAAGTMFGEALADHLASERDLPRRPLGGAPHSYVEAHIEQGPLLEAGGYRIGVVTGIQGSRWFSVTIEGASAHAGTAPLAMRRDALQDAVRAIGALNDLTRDPDDILRFTVGRMTITPNSLNSVAGQVMFTIDLRHPDAAVLGRIGDAIEQAKPRGSPGQHHAHAHGQHRRRRHLGLGQRAQADGHARRHQPRPPAGPGEGRHGRHGRQPQGHAVRHLVGVRADPVVVADADVLAEREHGGHDDGGRGPGQPVDDRQHAGQDRQVGPDEGHQADAEPAEQGGVGVLGQGAVEVGHVGVQALPQAQPPGDVQLAAEVVDGVGPRPPREAGHDDGSRGDRQRAEDVGGAGHGAGTVGRAITPSSPA